MYLNNTVLRLRITKNIFEPFRLNLITDTQYKGSLMTLISDVIEVFYYQS